MKLGTWVKPPRATGSSVASSILCSRMSSPIWRPSAYSMCPVYRLGLGGRGVIPYPVPRRVGVHALLRCRGAAAPEKRCQQLVQTSGQDIRLFEVLPHAPNLLVFDGNLVTQEFILAL